jgi:hypothetical protein
MVMLIYLSHEKRKAMVSITDMFILSIVGDPRNPPILSPCWSTPYHKGINIWHSVELGCPDQRTETDAYRAAIPGCHRANFSCLAKAV